MIEVNMCPAETSQILTKKRQCCYLFNKKSLSKLCYAVRAQHDRPGVLYASVKVKVLAIDNTLITPVHSTLYYRPIISQQ